MAKRGKKWGTQPAPGGKDGQGKKLRARRKGDGRPGEERREAAEDRPRAQGVFPPRPPARLMSGSSLKKGEEPMAEHQRQQPHEQYSFVMRLFSDVTDSWYDAARRAASYYVDIGEEFAKGAVEFQKGTTDFLKDASPLLEEQAHITREFVERSTDVARKLLNVQMERGEEAMHRATNRGEEVRFSGHS